MLFKIGVLEKLHIVLKTPVLESLFNKVAVLKTCNFIKKRLQDEIFKSSFFYRTPVTTTSETKHIHASAADLLHIRIGNLNWYKCEHCKKEVR